MDTVERNFAAESHLNTVHSQNAIIAGQAAEIARLKADRPSDTGASERFDLTKHVPLTYSNGAGQSVPKLTDAEIRSIFLANGFTVKEGQTDLKPYVFEAARAIEAKVLATMSADANVAAGGE